jgi:hypothetical protein
MPSRGVRFVERPATGACRRARAPRATARPVTSGRPGTLAGAPGGRTRPKARVAPGRNVAARRGASRAEERSTDRPDRGSSALFVDANLRATSAFARPTSARMPTARTAARRRPRGVKPGTSSRAPQRAGPARGRTERGGRPDPPALLPARDVPRPRRAFVRPRGPWPFPRRYFAARVRCADDASSRSGFVHSSSADCPSSATVNSSAPVESHLPRPPAMTSRGLLCLPSDNRVARGQYQRRRRAGSARPRFCGHPSPGRRASPSDRPARRCTRRPPPVAAPERRRGPRPSTIGIAARPWHPLPRWPTTSST